jgi:antagonist of KipI
MDMYSHRLANQLVGNSEDAAALEITLIGPELRVEGDLLCVVTGAEFNVLVGGHAVRHTSPFRVPSGASIRFGARQSGVRATLAIRGGIAVPPVLGSRSTSLLAGIGPFDGRALTSGDLLPIGEERRFDDAPWTAYPMMMPHGGARVRAIVGPHEATFSSETLERFFSARFRIASASNRTGYRLEGPTLTSTGAADLLSDATPVGSVQVPKSGQPILLMADRQTTGGYPKVATVITADLPLAGQLAPGDWIEFVPCTRAAALDALRHQERRLTGRGRP